MKSLYFIMIIMFASFNMAWANNNEVVEIDVSGMTCKFCVYSVTKSLKKIDGVSDVKVSLELEKTRIIMKPGASANIDEMKKVIIDAGFKPGKVKIISKEQ